MTIKNATIQGRIVAEPTDKRISEKFSILTFPLYSDHRIKNRETGEWENDPNGTTKLTVELKFDKREEWLGTLHKGDVIKLTGSIFERGYETKDGRQGRQLQTDYIEAIEVVFSSAPAEEDDFATADSPF